MIGITGTSEAAGSEARLFGRRRPVAGLLAGIVRLYQLLCSPLLASRCRFEPSCSSYARQALLAHGAVRGCGLALWRLLRCQPFATGGYDPVPEPAPGASGRSVSSEAPAHAGAGRC